MTNDKALAVFENFKIRRIFDEKSETWYFSVVDVVAALSSGSLITKLLAIAGRC